MHRFEVGQRVFFEGPFGDPGARGSYEITRQVPVENDNKIVYRIKSPIEAFERVAEEYQLKSVPF